MTTEAERKFASNGIQIGSVFIMKPVVAIDFVKHCQQAGIAVYGVEGFLRIHDGIQPQQEHSCDYDPQSDDGYSLTISFLNDRLETDLWFEVVTDEPPC